MKSGKRQMCLWRDDWGAKFYDHFCKVSVFETRSPYISYDVVSIVHQVLRTDNVQIQMNGNISTVLNSLRIKWQYNPQDNIIKWRFDEMSIKYK